MIKKDGHTHTQFSHHGSTEQLDMYIERAIDLGFTEYVVTEHAPLPQQFLEEFVGPDDARDNSAMAIDELTFYKSEVERVKEKFKDKINIKSGFEVDYLKVYETDIRSFLQRESNWIDEIVLSVHFLPNNEGNVAPIDYESDTLSAYFSDECRNPQILFKRYYDAVIQSVNFDTGLKVPVRIGHITLIRKYQKLLHLPKFDESIKQQITELLAIIKQKNYQLDFNAAGFSKPYNGESYPTFDIAEQAKKIGIGLVYGSDAHEVNALGLYYDEMKELIVDKK
ncbi:histidinol-phosphatase HisJ [Leuconostoc mesenteroides]|uniref:histidinol-phosphatase HisJ n=1 Tax=Leuconostoc mesenteroides TaxID=1245 RepID=UPI00065E4952|nr:histidinol-phosphatase HisJ [Leuconostoc mesenteroides]AKP35735.1 histidinol phosphatase [Leuconostoc mesenteroides subsp. dextranicum]MBZ1510018.1 histidinol-phosphatase HisJ [Leuconostoc mesenteroides]MBZ1524297.1 histidinol-phosphatase HisJ [Leuconostoc mesenteroides]MCT3049127.1 histidinol-phosphatase HisJ [Leuconostoc mesenteroides]ORI94331.1 histidinol-phosphatase [Leuconostoc mesenteroides subsp. mesenteroides]